MSVSRAHLIASSVAIAALSYLVACIYLWHAQKHLIFLPDALVEHTPTEVGLNFANVAIPVADGSVIAAWWLPRASADIPSSVVLYLHGNDGNLGHELPRLQVLHSYGLPILAIDYRGYGRSTGPFPSEVQLYDDAVAAWNYLVDIQHFDPQSIVLYGHSLGAAVAVELALRRGPTCGVVLESAFTSMTDVARLEYPWIPVNLLLNHRFDVLQRIGGIEEPIFLVHGSADREVPSTMSKRLYSAARAPKRLLLVDGAGHEDAMMRGGESLRPMMKEFTGRCSR